MRFVRCRMCNVEISSEKCELANCRKVIDGEEYYFCCERHAEEFARKRRGNPNA